MTGARSSIPMIGRAPLIIALFLSDLQRNRVVLQSELADGLPAITGDRIQLRQVVLNLLRNRGTWWCDQPWRPFTRARFGQGRWKARTGRLRVETHRCLPAYTSAQRAALETRA